MPDEYLDGLSAEQRATSWAQGLASPAAPNQARLVVEAGDGEVVGFVVTGPSRSGESAGEVQVLNVHPAHWGRGMGRLLLAAAESELRAADFAVAVLWVVEGNVRARRFYESAGWHPDGGSKVDDRFGTGVVEVRYRIELLP
ncbi:MAG TPA: GNAT family N-acetyltransferase [Acidimicrobiales bacterium]|nr:GNAT family N-acetyltransferase [Acidimicrobiales bacterium]